MVYGADEMQPPPLATMHARLLAAAYDAGWVERLRQRLRIEAAALAAQCAWLAQLGDPDTMRPAELLALDAMLPAARGAVQQHINVAARRRDLQAEECSALQAQLASGVDAIRRGAGGALGAARCAELEILLAHHFELLARIGSAEGDGPGWQALRKAAARTQARCGQLRLQLDALAERRAENAGWLSMQTLGLLLLAIVLLPVLLGVRADLLLTALGAGVAGWRLLPLQSMKRRIRELARGL